MPRPEEMGKEAWDKLTATVSDDQLEWIERFARYDQAEFIPSYATLGLIARLRAAEVDAGRYRKMRSIIQAEHPEVTDEQYDRDFDCEMSSEGVTK